MPDSRPPQALQDLVDLYRSPLHSHYRQELDRLSVPPDAPFKRKLAAFRPDRLFAWIWNYLKNRIGPRCKFPTYGQGETGVFDLGDDSLIGGCPWPSFARTEDQLFL